MLYNKQKKLSQKLHYSPSTCCIQKKKKTAQVSMGSITPYEDSLDSKVNVPN